MVYALREGLRLVLEEGLEARFARHRRNHAALAAGLAALGLEYIAGPACRLPQLNAVRLPEGVDDVAGRKRLLSEFGIEVGGGLGEFKGKAWRIGLMGYNSRPELRLPGARGAGAGAPRRGGEGGTRGGHRRRRAGLHGVRFDRMNTTIPWPPDILDRMVRAVEKVRQRLLQSARALEAGKVPYAVIGGNAVAAFVAKIDEGSVRNTRDVDILIRREDLEAAKAAMDAAGFDFAEVAGVALFVERPDGKPSEGVHLLFAGEKVKETDPVSAPEMSESEDGVAFRVLSLEALVRMKLVAFRLKDQVHLQDMARLGLIDATWPARYPEVLAERLRQILANPDG
jgi:hypothetical protein